MNRISICIAFAVLTATTPDAIAARNFLLPQVPQFVGNQVNQVFLVTELDGRKIASTASSDVGFAVSTELRAVDYDITSNAPIGTPTFAASVVVTTFHISSSTPAARTVLESDVEAGYSRRASEFDYLSDEGVIDRGVVINSHALIYHIDFSERPETAPYGSLGRGKEKLT